MAAADHLCSIFLCFVQGDKFQYVDTSIMHVICLGSCKVASPVIEIIIKG